MPAIKPRMPRSNPFYLPPRSNLKPFLSGNIIQANFSLESKERSAWIQVIIKWLVSALILGFLLFNGFHTIDAYVNNYPLDYKKTFRKIIARELEKNEVIRSLFDDFGSTCYLFSSEIGARNVNKNEDIKVTGLELNHAALRELDCHYIISAVEIVNHESNHLVYWERFEEPNSPWKIFVYKNQTLEPNI